MTGRSIRTSVDLPRDLHQRLHELAARRHCSARKLILQSIEAALAANAPQRPRRRLSLDTPIVPPTGRPIHLTEDDIYGGIEFP